MGEKHTNDQNISPYNHTAKREFPKAHYNNEETWFEGHQRVTAK